MFLLKIHLEFLKGGFRQVLHLDMHYMSKITKFILACCVLHNLCIDKNDFIDLHVDTENLHNVNNELPLLVDSEVELRKKGERKRDAIKNGLVYL